jgi:hypothetical protein
MGKEKFDRSKPHEEAPRSVSEEIIAKVQGKDSK